MNKKELWVKFMATGKISDYIQYKRAEGDFYGGEEIDVDFSDEFAVSQEDYYDFEDGRYSDS